MAERKKTTMTGKNVKRKGFSFFSDMDEVRKSSILKYTGIAVAVFALFTLISSVSYLFTWQEDQSLMTHPDMLDRNVEVSNWAGKVGYRWGTFLVARCFGLGSFALIFLLAAVAYRLFFWKKSIGLLRTAFVSVSGTFVASLLLAFVSLKFGADTAFGGGLGGDAGHAVIRWMENLVGSPVTGFIILAFLIAWLLLSSRRFAEWFAATGNPSEMSIQDENITAVDPVTDELVQDDPFFDDLMSYDPVITEPVMYDPDLSESEPEPESVSEPVPSYS